jgi:polyhydroxybutyrate depolymerase
MIAWKRGGLKMPKKTLLLLAVLFLILVTVFGFGSVTFASEVTTVRMEHGGYERTFDYYVPPSYDGSEAIPVVFSFHGLGRDPAEQQLLTRMVFLAEDEGFIAVFPASTTLEGTHEALPALPDANKQWNVGLPRSLQYFEGVDDVGFVEAIIDYLTGEYNIDKAQVFATGFSNGAMFSYYLAAKIPDKIAGVGAVGAGAPLNIAEMKDELKPLPVIIIMGTEDPIVPYEGREGSFMSAEATAAFWVEINGINSEPEVEYLDPIKDDDPTRIKRTSWTDGIDGTAVILYTVEGGGHTWPGGHQYFPEEFIGLSSQQMDGSAAIWKDFVEHGYQADAELSVEYGNQESADLNTEDERHDDAGLNWTYYAGAGALLLLIILIFVRSIRKKKQNDA